MRAKVVKRFIDKDTKKLMEVGTAQKPTIIDVSEERFNELVKAGKYVVPVEEGEGSGQTESAARTTADILDDVLNDMTVEELREHAAKYGVDLTGIRNKPEIIEAIKAGGRVETTTGETGASVDAQNTTDGTENGSEDVQNDSEKAVEDMTLAELKAYAEEHGIELNGARTKAAIIEAINRTPEEGTTTE